MYCQNCGEEIKKGLKVCEKCGAKLTESAAVQAKPQIRSLTSNQKATLAAIRKYEKKVKLRLGEKGFFSKKYGKLLKKPEKAISEKKRLTLKKKQVVERFKNAKIPMRIPLHLPTEIIKEINEKKVKEISLQRIEKGERLKLYYTTKDGKTKDIATAAVGAFSGHSAFVEKQKLPFVGLGVVKDDEGSKLDIIIPSTPTSLRSKTTKNQGDVLYLKSKAIKRNNKKTEHNTGTQEDGLNNMLSDLITPGTTSNLLGLSQHRLDNVAWHDFSYYEYIQEPEVFTYATEDFLSESMLEMLDNLDDPSLEIAELLSIIRQTNYHIRQLVYFTPSIQGWGNVWDIYTASDIELIIDAYQTALIESGALSTICEVYFLTPMDERKVLFQLHSQWSIFPDGLSNMTTVLVRGWKSGDFSLPELLAEWQDESQRLYQINAPYFLEHESFEKAERAISMELEYPFVVFIPHTCNLGLRLVYRQEWRPLGIQRGETVKTIPLGPKQVEKVSTKIFRRRKVSKTAESLKVVETTTETSDTSKDSSEIVKEAAETNKWNAEAEAGLDIGFFKIGGGGGGSGESEEKSKRTSTHLTETMQKTASKLRTETKIVVSTESESTFEITTASEIQNPNDEIPITYVFSKLQRQYEILTRLAEVNGVVFIAEPIPLPHQVTKEWVKKHDWIIAKALLDDSFRDALTSISNDSPQESLPEDVLTRISTALTNSEGFLSSLAGTAQHLALENVDLSQEAQRAYREIHKEELERKRSRDLLDQKIQRLLQHIRENILHYCRAIWSQEDPEQRMLRYKKLDIRIPTIWRFVIEGDTEIPIMGWSVSGLPPGVKGHFEPNVTDVDTVRPITELINPAGPIGYAGNYAIYYLKSDAEIDLERKDNLFDMLHLMKSFYIDLETGEFMDPAIRTMSDENSSSYITVPDPIPIKQRKEMTEYVPEIRAEYEGLDETEKDAFIKDGLTPEERKEFKAIADANGKKVFLKENCCFENPDLYYEYLFRKKYSRRFLVDTNNLILDLEAGTGSALEAFKKLHRYVDVLKAIEEKEKMNEENQRRQKLIDSNKLGDPDIEKVTIITGKTANLNGLIADVDEED